MQKTLSADSDSKSNAIADHQGSIGSNCSNRSRCWKRLERFELLERLELYFAEHGTRQSAQEPDRRTERIFEVFCYECADYWRDGSQRRGDGQAVGKRGATSRIA